MAERSAGDDAVLRWAASGAMALTGPADGPALGPPAGLVDGMTRFGAVLERRSTQLGRPVAVDALQLLGERAAIAGLSRHGAISCGGGTRLLETSDGWLAVSLARADDIDLLPAWLALDDAAEDPWGEVARAAAEGRAGELAERAVLLGLPVSALPASTVVAQVADPALSPLPCRTERLGDSAPTTEILGLRVVDLSSLWAGPLCGSLLALAGAEVVKVESTSRPDGARRGPAPFFDLLNGDKRSVSLDLRRPEGVRAVRRLISSADVVIESSRPRALEQLGIDAAELVRDGGPRVWLSITGHGRAGEARDRVGFGDDAAVAGGLVCWHEGRPLFCADAVADPAAGMAAAAVCLDALATGGRWLVDVGMSGVAAHLSGPTLPVPAGTTAAAPRARTPTTSAPPLGAHNRLTDGVP
jgi:crotonobetainyl-CoA:carnitine CoA-transferase CaiB-like acyl-CoA transferase